MHLNELANLIATTLRKSTDDSRLMCLGFRGQIPEENGLFYLTHDSYFLDARLSEVYCNI